MSVMIYISGAESSRRFQIVTTQELAIAVTQTEQIAAVFAARARRAKLDNEPGTYLENIRKFEECQRWLRTFKEETTCTEPTHFDNI